jgi:RNA polymerase subunit RPABC4/transcription elongation factor Spt4
MKCRECGSYVEPGSEYCPECGADLPVKKRGRRGFNCGAQLEGGDEICPDCGVATGMDEDEDTEL